MDCARKKSELKLTRLKFNWRDFYFSERRALVTKANFEL